MDLTGKAFGKWTAIQSVVGCERPSWDCVCECGTKRAVRRSFLLSGISKSCGCSRIENAVKATKKHGMRNTNLYAVWNSMKVRCRNKNSAAYHNYGGRGIQVCDEWMDFKKFYEWALSNGYEKGCEIDRIDNNGNYEPGNCRFVTPKKNMNNRRTNRYLTINGETKTIAEWSETTGINRVTLRSRVMLGWNENDLLKPIGVNDHE